MFRIATASLVGTTIEFYDFLIYGTAAALVFGPLFFPSLGAGAATLASIATFGVAFVVRPLGAILFGHYGDRLGRKKTLVTTLLIMGGSTFAIGLMPTADAIGAAAPILLVALRALQGLALGGEWAGAALLTSEYADHGKRGRYSMYPQLGPGLGVALSSGTFLVTGLGMSPENFIDWGWRIPFLASAVLIAVGLWVRLNIAETPAFARTIATKEQVKLPFADALHDQWRQILLGGGMLSMTFGSFYIAIVFLTSYAGRGETGVLGLSRETILIVNILAAGVLSAAVIGSAIWSDRIGRRRVLLTGTIFGIVAGPLAFAVMEPGSAISFFLAMSLLMLVLGIPYGPAAAYLPELFKTRYRYTGAGMSYNLAGILGGALPLVVADPLIKAFGGMGVAYFLSALGVVSTGCLLLLKETKDVAIADTNAGSRIA
ncbi:MULTISPECIES: MFS transporter [Rhodococcus]|uniref:MFS transporter n=1 Tax=Rhodococcus oxybenzonivorans TaxID=1990687 RepID=A0AAE4UVW2_9NOCA|nr:MULTISPECIES: MFS transporter [Rhodococcus]MDV7243379.1 MFS transporter [Rhodococcus oxybenzonivorans]MDV7263921.1 MFS transporter [Rhodococcus oxybenzonivorans]MDV7276805.1 MFS transporter [Rhodococcus oxybenzonivorans]MDV7334361.1 MFS transporter [Rhodococcus oxybenzonivorans]MDV7344516.1 MFS transporter [Rhodococcus oxybenzonivorans]